MRTGTQAEANKHVWLGIALGVGFIALSLAVWSGLLAGIDRRLLLSFRVPDHPAVALGPAWLVETERDVTGLGSNAVMGFFAVAAAGALALARDWRNLATLLTAALSVQTLCALLKTVAQRPRPDLIPDIPYVFTTSFPSSHAMVSAATLFTLAAIATRLASGPAIGRYAFALAAFVATMIGLSRIALGVHWPSDVLAGWIAGLFCGWGSCALLSRPARRADAPPPDR